jgi:topoisomerase-4 subunit A
VHYFAGAASAWLLLANSGGYGFLATVENMVSRQKGGKGFLSLEEDEKPLPPSVADGAQRVACLTLAGRLLVFGLDELKLQANGGRGLTLIDLDPKDALVSVAAFGSALQVLGAGRGGKPKDELLKGAALTPYVGKRARKGRAQDVMQKAIRVVAAAL